MMGAVLNQISDLTVKPTGSRLNRALSGYYAILSQAPANRSVPGEPVQLDNGALCATKRTGSVIS
jgi:hypothetical protein